MDIKKVLGQNVAKYRKLEGITQEELSERLEINPKHLSNIESGKKFVSASLLENIINELNIHPSSLFYTTDGTGIDNTDLGRIDAIIDEKIKELKNEMRESII